MDKVSGFPGDTTPFGLDIHCLAIGFSVRALVQALREAGFSVIALDAFGDYDTRESAKVPQIITEWGAADPENALQGVSAFYRELHNPLGTDIFRPVFMAGGCENWPELVSYLRKLPSIRILGPSADQMLAFRSPELWSACTEGTSVGFPTSVFVGSQIMAHEPPYPPLFQSSTTWLRKSRSSGGGMGVFHCPKLHCSKLQDFYHDETSEEETSEEETRDTATQQTELGDTATYHKPSGDTASTASLPNVGHGGCTDSGESTDSGDTEAAGSPEGSSYYFQAFVPGRTLGATCIVSRDASANPYVTFVGATESWQAADWTGPTPFIYRGSFGPLPLTQSQVQSIEQLAMSLVRTVDAVGGGEPEELYRGWIQMDLIEDPELRLWLLEVNPRWTAGMEVLRLSGLVNPVRLHAQAFGIRCPTSTQATTTGTSELWIGKAIYYAPHAIPLTEPLVRKLHQHCHDGFFDLPSIEAIGSQIEPGHPLLTIVVTLDRQSLSYEQARREALSQLEQKRMILQEWIDRIGIARS